MQITKEYSHEERSILDETSRSIDHATSVQITFFSFATLQMLKLVVLPSTWVIWREEQ